MSRAEGWAVLAFCAAASTAAIFWSWRHGAMTNYGDAIAHLHIARRIFDSRLPRFSELGSVWLPLPHILLLPFVQNYSWWATGLAGVIPSALAYLASCVGIYRLARKWLAPAPAALALVFFALNPNLLYLQTTAMTEPLFLCVFVWIVVWLVEWRAALDAETVAGTEHSMAPLARPAKNAIAKTTRLQIYIALALIAAIFSRYDGWVIALIAWSGIALTIFRHAAEGERARITAPAFWLATIAIVAAPLLWFLYNRVCFGDWLFFARGPYSPHAIELRTAANAPGWPPHPGWHNPWVALLFYLKVSELDSAVAPGWGSLWGNIVLALAAAGTMAASLSERSRSRRRAIAWIFLLWLPVPFYAWSVAYGSVPIFFPAWWPYTWYNTRYGLELLPALALGLAFAAELITDAIGRLKLPSRAPVQKLAFAILFALGAVNVVALLQSRPIVYVESTKNADARRPYDNSIPTALRSLLTLDPHATILMNTSIYPEIVSFTGIPLRQTINEGDLGIYDAALVEPAAHAAIVVTFEGDQIDAAVKAHRADFTLIGDYSAKNQPSAAIYASNNWLHRAPDFF
ncbi:MAG TPA: hypothetical protein VMT38_09115 [Terracidiphilus sp.]|nr:hypothetical protein [Terracidiphilus sp.]